jgi:predicted XRE-type DNA-binding protein
MPKIYLTKQQQLNNRLVTLIYGKMKVKRFTQRYMAERLGISQPAFARKLKNCQFTYADLTTIFETLDMQDEEILSVTKI